MFLLKANLHHARDNYQIMELEIYIVGASRLQNELLTCFLENSTGLNGMSPRFPLFVRIQEFYLYFLTNIKYGNRI